MTPRTRRGAPRQDSTCKHRPHAPVLTNSYFYKSWTIPPPGGDPLLSRGHQTRAQSPESTIISEFPLARYNLLLTQRFAHDAVYATCSSKSGAARRVRRKNRRVAEESGAQAPDINSKCVHTASYQHPAAYIPALMRKFGVPPPEPPKFGEVVRRSGVVAGAAARS